jgi:hypothetical protein
MRIDGRLYAGVTADWFGLLNGGRQRTIGHDWGERGIVA